MNAYIKLTIGGVIVLILVSVGCYFWYQWITEPYRQVYEKTQQSSHEWTTANKSVETVHALDDVEITDVVPAENKSVSAEKTSVKIDTTVEKTNIQDASVVEPISTEALDISPYGLGAYPQIPASWPQDIQFFPTDTIEHELMIRVEIKLTNQGIEVMGSTMENGRVYPNIDGRVYVRWTNDPHFGRYISEVGGHPETAMRFEMLLEAFEEQSDRNFCVSDAPADIKIVDYDDAGIEPYSFLGL